jgi:hypothetical protein
MQWGVVLRQRRRFGWVQIGWHLQSLFFASIVPAGVGGDAMRCAAAGPQAGTGATLATLAASRLSGTLGPPEWSEGPSGSAAGLLGRDRIGILGQELVDVPRRRARAGCAVLVGEAAVGHGRCPAAPGEHFGEAP